MVKKSKKRSGKKRRNDKSKEHKSFLNSRIGFVILALVVAFTSFMMYKATTDYDLVFCDDNIFVLDFYQFNRDPGNYIETFKKTVGVSYYRPMLIVTFMIDAQRGEVNPGVYRQTNLILHILASILVFSLLIKLGYQRIVSFFFSLIFTLHPILTPSASWISGRNDSLLAIFIISSFMLYLKFHESKKRIGLYFSLHLFFFACAVFTKEIATVLPLVVLSYIIIIQKDRLLTRENIILGSAYAIIGAIWFWMRSSATLDVPNPDEFGIEPFFINFPTLFAMLGKIFLPVKMIALASYEMFTIITGIIVFAGIAIAVFMVKGVNKRRVLFGTIWFFILLVPSFFIRIAAVGDFFDYAEHRALIPMIGLIIVVIEILYALKIDFKKPLPIFIAIFLVTIMGVRSHNYKQVFENRQTFWGHMVDSYPFKARGYLDLGKAYYAKKDLKKAKELYLKGYEVNPDNHNFMIDLSAVMLSMNDPEKAEYYAKEALKKEPENPIANYNLGKSYANRGWLEKSIEPTVIAIKHRNFPEWHMSLGRTYFQLKRYEEAIEVFKNILTFNPQNPLAHSNIGAILATTGKGDEALIHWQEALKINPRFEEVYTNLINYYMAKEDADMILQTIRNMQYYGRRMPASLRKKLKDIGFKF